MIPENRRTFNFDRSIVLKFLEHWSPFASITHIKVEYLKNTRIYFFYKNLGHKQSLMSHTKLELLKGSFFSITPSSSYIFTAYEYNMTLRKLPYPNSPLYKQSTTLSLLLVSPALLTATLKRSKTSKYTIAVKII
jgi:hypothetical protein